MNHKNTTKNLWKYNSDSKKNYVRECSKSMCTYHIEIDGDILCKICRKHTQRGFGLLKAFESLVILYFYFFKYFYNKILSVITSYIYNV